MFGRETRMLLRHYLEQGTSKSALARKLGVHRDAILRRIRDGELDRDLDGEPVRYGPRRPVATKLDAYKSIVEARLSAAKVPRLVNSTHLAPPSAKAWIAATQVS